MPRSRLARAAVLASVLLPVAPAGAADSLDAAVSPDGRYVVFTTDDTALGTGVQGNGAPQVFRHDRLADADGEKTLVSFGDDGWPASTGASEPDVSADGRFIVFTSDAPDLLPGDGASSSDVFWVDTATERVELVSIRESDRLGAPEDSDQPSIDDTGLRIAFRSLAQLSDADTDTTADVYLYDHYTGGTTLLSTGPGVAGDPQMAGNGAYVVFTVTGQGLSQVFRHTIFTGTTALVSATPGGAPGNGSSGHASVSADGRYVALRTSATDLVAPDTNNQLDIVLRDMTTATTTRVSQSDLGVQADDVSDRPSVSADGMAVAFESLATNLVGATDGDGQTDVFVWTPTLLSRVSGTATTNALRPVVAGADGRFVAWDTGSQLAASDTDSGFDVYLTDRQPSPDVHLHVSAPTQALAPPSAPTSAMPLATPPGAELRFAFRDTADAPQEDGFDVRHRRFRGHWTLTSVGARHATGATRAGCADGELANVSVQNVCFTLDGITRLPGVELQVRARRGSERSAWTTLLTPTERDLRVTVEGPAQVGPEGEIEHVITVRNDGPGPLDSVILQIGGSGELTPSAGTCIAQPPMECALGSLAAGASRTVSVTRAAADVGAAMVTSGHGYAENNADPSPFDANASATTFVIAPPAPDADGDGDGVPDASDACPQTAAATADGCPAAAAPLTPPPPPPAAPLVPAPQPPSAPSAAGVLSGLTTSGRLRRLPRRGLPVRARCSAACSVAISVSLGGRRIGTARARALRAGPLAATVRLSRATRRRLARLQRARLLLRATVSVPGVAPVVVTRPVTLRR